MRLPSKAEYRGFTLIELLTVVAIMAVVTALIFPVASGMRDRGNQSACIGNLQNIGQALKVYRLDERDYPLALYGYVVDRNNNGPQDDEPTTFLYPHYMRARRDFKCPNNAHRLNEAQFAGPFVGKKPGAWAPLQRVNHPGTGMVVEPVTTLPIYYYAFDSYDGAVLPSKVRANGNIVPIVMSPIRPANPQYEQHYRRDWATLFGVTADPLAPLATRELLNRNPEDSTYVTTCTYHRDYRTDASGNSNLPVGARSTDIVLFLDGHAEKIPSSEVALQGMSTLPRQS